MPGRRSEIPEGIDKSFLKVLLHLLFDAFTSAGIQPPLFRSLQILWDQFPFVLNPSGESLGRHSEVANWPVPSSSGTAT